MAGYSFKLEKVLNYKEKVEDIKKAELAERNRRLYVEEERLLFFNNHKENILSRKKSTQNASVGEYKLYSSYINDLSNIIKNQKKLVADAKDEVDKAKEELIVAMQERKSFERLKEIQYEEYLIDLKKREEKLLDGIVTYKTNTRQ